MQQFWLDLGQVNLNQNGEYEFNISGLPSVEFYAQILLGMKHYFNVRPSPAVDKPSWFDDVSVDLVLAENGEKLPAFQFVGTLSQLTWTNVAPKPYASALYASGDGGTDSGWFVPKPNAQYKLSLKVQSSKKNAVPAKVMFIGGAGNSNLPMQITVLMVCLQWQIPMATNNSVRKRFQINGGQTGKILTLMMMAVYHEWRLRP